MKLNRWSIAGNYWGVNYYTSCSMSRKWEKVDDWGLYMGFSSITNRCINTSNHGPMDFSHCSWLASCFRYRKKEGVTIKRRWTLCRACASNKKWNVFFCIYHKRKGIGWRFAIQRLPWIVLLYYHGPLRTTPRKTWEWRVSPSMAWIWSIWDAFCESICRHGSPWVKTDLIWVLVPRL